MNTNFGQRIRMLRIAKHMTQAELAKKLDVSKSMISSYESDMRKPSPDVLVELAKVFGVSMDIIFDNTQNDAGHSTLIEVSHLYPHQLATLFTMINEFSEKNKLEMLIKEHGVVKTWKSDEQIAKEWSGLRSGKSE